MYVESEKFETTVFASEKEFVFLWHIEKYKIKNLEYIKDIDFWLDNIRYKYDFY